MRSANEVGNKEVNVSVWLNNFRPQGAALYFLGLLAKQGEIIIILTW